MKEYGENMQKFEELFVILQPFLKQSLKHDYNQQDRSCL